MSVDYADGSYFGGNVATEIGENVADLSGGTTSNVGGDGAFVGEGVRSGIDSWDKAYTNAGGTLPARFGLSDLKQFATDNKSWLAGAGALASAYGGGTTADKKTGYQGGIPALAASRSMIAAPPTRAQGYRPGAGGIDYGGDVSYTRAPGVDPWANLSGTSGSSAGANLTSLPADVATAVNNAITGGTNTATKVDTTKVDTTKTNTTTLTQAQKDALAVENWRKSLSPTQYLDAINQWIASNPNMSKADLDAAMTKFKVSQTDLQTALGANKKLSAADIYALSHGQGLKEANAQQTAGIVDWITKNPYATATQVKDAIKASGVNETDIKEALVGKPVSKGYQDALLSGGGLNTYYNTINKYLEDQARDTTTPGYLEEFSRAKAKQDFGVSDADIAAAQKYAATEAGKKELAALYPSAPNLENSIKSILEDKTSATNWEAENAAKWERENAAKWEAQHAAEVATAQEAAQRVANENVQIPSNNQSTASTAGDNKDDIYQYFADPATQAILAAGDTRSIAETMQALGWSPAEVAAATGSNPAEVQAAYDAALGSDTSYMQYAAGGMAKGRYLQGETDGMADKLPAQIGRNQPAALSHGEFVIPADVVSHMGNGNSDAGAKKLYQMMDKIRMARTGNKKQGKKINPDKFMPGGLAQAYASGGEVQHFQEGGAAKNYAAGLTGVESNLSNWAGPYVTNMLGQGQALANMPYQAYMGQLSGGESPLQTSAFNNAANLQTPSSIGTAATEAGKIGTAAQGLNYSPTSFTNQYASPVGASFDASQATAYMNPYLQTSLQPQLDEARRQSQITQTQNAAKMTQAGAFGGGRQAILDAETQRNLGTNLAGITGQGYNTAYGNAMNQFNADQARKIQEAQLGAQYGSAAQQATEQSKQYGSGFGLQGLQTGLQAAQAQGALGSQESQAGLNTLNTQLAAGAQQRGIESEGIAADKAQFEEARANPYKMVQYQQSLLQGLPLAAQSYQGIAPSDLTKAAQGASTVNQLLKNLGLA